MPNQIVITEKTSQAKDVRAAVGSRYGDVLPAEGHLFDLLEPEDVVPAWKHWSPILLRPEGLYDTRPAEGGNKAAKLKTIREALRTAKRVWLATDRSGDSRALQVSRRSHAGTVPVEATPALPNRGTGTPLRIPYGNKEVAMKLGARYGSTGWYAPPGVDLSAFDERGWL
jgi:hypothetical protein